MANKNEDSKALVKTLRARTGLSQTKFGNLFKISMINIANWEQGITRPPEYVMYMLERLCEIDPNVPRKADSEENE